MQRLRTTFKRSRTPTGAEMKSQSSLEVPKQIRSASFDEIQLQAQRRDDGPPASRSSVGSPARSRCSSTRVRRRSSTLKVPQLQTGQRSKSFDAYSASSGSSSGGYDRPETPLIQVSGCYHCVCVEEYRRLIEIASRQEAEAEALRDLENNDADRSENESEDRDDQPKREGSPEIRVTLTTSDDDDEDDDDDGDGDDGDENKDDNDDENKNDDQSRGCTPPAADAASEPGSEMRMEFPMMERQRRLSRQEALTSFPLELPASYLVGARTEEDRTVIETISVETEDDDDAAAAVAAEESAEVDGARGASKFVVRDIFLTVPELKRDRAASVDSCFNNNKNGSGIADADSLAVPQQGIRSKSVDIVLPTDVRTRYTALLPGKEPRPTTGGREEGDSSSDQRQPRSTPDWGPHAYNEEHLWIPTAASGDFCYVNDCSKHGPRLKCPVCHIVIHACCVTSLEFPCKPSFHDVSLRQYREQTTTHHHWVHRRSQKGKCANCGKSFQSKLSFGSKEIVAVSCSWCKTAYHNRESCFNVEKIGECCDLGGHESIIVPPSWIVKLPRKGTFKSSLKKSPRRKKPGDGGPASADRRRRRDNEMEEEKEKSQGMQWIIKPIPTATAKPVVVFINPKSGGNQGAKLLQKFQWLLNPRQVFDLTQGGPKMGLDLFKKVPNLRVLACGGDGTVGWVLSILDQIGAYPPPAVGVLPLGTGNDLARALGWGGGYTDEPIGKILTSIGDSETTSLDRWQLKVERNRDARNDDDGNRGKENLPLNVVNNYFSLGVDAHIALEFHEAREAHPEKFNSRLRNKMFYGQMGGKDLLRRKWKDLSEFVTLECDGQDMTPKLKEHRVHAIVFLNIASYGGGTRPWGAGSGTREPAMDDGLIEVVGLTTYQLPLLQAGGHGTSIAQCSTAKLVTTRTIPMQVDGEACRLLPAIVTLSLLNKATMLVKRRNTGKRRQSAVRLERLKLPVLKIKMSDYKTYHHDKDRLKEGAELWLAEPLELEATTDLESLRKLLAKERNMDSCCFVDSCTAERLFRIDRAQEQLHYVTDVAGDAVYILEEDATHQSEGHLIAGHGKETVHAYSSDEGPRSETTATTTEEERRQRRSVADDSKDARRRSSVGERARLSKRSESGGESDGTAAIRATSSASRRNSFLLLCGVANKDKDVEDDSPVNGEPRKRDSSEDQTDRPIAFISPRDRLFGLSSGVHRFGSGLLERTCDGILNAAKTGDLVALKQLHEQGYSLLSIDANGQTALHLASKHGHKEIVRYLIACAPPTILNMIDNDKGQTALHKAAQNRRRSICCMLVAGGAALMVRDRLGRTPRDLALVAEDCDLAAYLYSQEQFQLVTDEHMENIL